MKIVMTNTVTKERTIVTFNEVRNILAKGQYNSEGVIWANYKLLNNEVIADGNLEFKREIS